MTTATQARPQPVKVDIQLMGRAYSLACEAGEEKRLETLAGYLDAKLRTLAGSVSSAGESRLFMLAALMLTDEIFDLKARNGAGNATSGATASAATMNDTHEAAIAGAVEQLTERLQKIVKRLNEA